MAVKPFVIHGAGQGRIISVADGSVLLRLDKLTEMRLSAELTTEDVFGGDGLVAFESFATEYGATVTLTNARFTPDMFRVQSGATVTEAQPAEIWVFDEGVVIPAADEGDTVTVDLKHKESYVAGSITVRYKDTGEALTEAAAAPSKAGEYSIAAGVLTFFVGANGDKGRGVVYDYQYTDANTTEAVLKADPKLVPVKIIHTGKYLRNDNSYGGLQTEIYLARYMGAFEIVQGQRTASTHAMTFRVLDPERADGAFMRFKHFDIAAT